MNWGSLNWKLPQWPILAHLAVLLYGVLIVGFWIGLGHLSTYAQFIFFRFSSIIGFIVVVYVFVQVIMAIISLLWPEKLVELSKDNNYVITVIIPAYLPNEQFLITSVLDHYFTRVVFPCRYRIVLAYNTNQDLPVEAELQELEAKHPQFKALRVPGSHSKAENINYLLRNLESTDEWNHIVSIFDADHMPDSDCFEVVLRNYETNPEMCCLQGRCMIRNHTDSFMTRLVDVEFDMIYNIFHRGFQRLHAHGIFGGSNGHWRLPVLYSVRMDEHMLTEDIDSCIRTLANNMLIRYDPRVRSTEEAPSEFLHYFKQRVRWAQGWFEVSVNRGWWAVSSINDQHFKTSLFMLLLFRELSFHVQAFLTVQVVYGFITSPVFDELLWIPISNGVILALILPIFCHRKLASVLLGLFFVWYLMFQTYLGLLAEARQILGVHQWDITPRTETEKSFHEHQENVVVVRVQ